MHYCNQAVGYFNGAVNGRRHILITVGLNVGVKSIFAFVLSTPVIKIK